MRFDWIALERLLPGEVMSRIEWVTDSWIDLRVRLFNRRLILSFPTEGSWG